jgi:hypothetical protein
MHPRAARLRGPQPGITADTDLASYHFLVRISGTILAGTDGGMWVRDQRLRVLDKGRKIVHEHGSCLRRHARTALLIGDVSPRWAWQCRLAEHASYT